MQDRMEKGGIQDGMEERDENRMEKWDEDGMDEQDARQNIQDRMEEQDKDGMEKRDAPQNSRTGWRSRMLLQRPQQIPRGVSAVLSPPSLAQGGPCRAGNARCHISPLRLPRPQRKLRLLLQITFDIQLKAAAPGGSVLLPCPSHGGDARSQPPLVPHRCHCPRSGVTALSTERPSCIRGGVPGSHLASPRPLGVENGRLSGGWWHAGPGG